MLLRERHAPQERTLSQDNLHRPVDELPSLSAEVTPGEEFWSRRNMRPDSDGSSFRNAPVLGVGITYEGSEATLLVPTVEEYNATVDRHNPGGFHLVPVRGQIDGKRFLQHIAKKEFPWSQTRTAIKVADYYSTARDRFEGREIDIYNPHFLQTNTYEHDLADHGGIGLLDTWEAGKLAFFADIAQQLDESDQAVMVDLLDSLLGLFSDYALLPAEGLTEFQVSYKNFQQSRMKLLYRDIKRLLRFSVADPEIFNPNFATMDANIQRMQNLGWHDHQSSRVGSAALGEVMTDS
jgi:hypothetical protein